MTDVTPKFSMGQRVIVAAQIVSEVDFLGYYGHVVAVHEPDPQRNSLRVPLYDVSLTGRSNGQPALDFMLDRNGDDPAPFFENELEAAD